MQFTVWDPKPFQLGCLVPLTEWTLIWSVIHTHTIALPTVYPCNTSLNIYYKIVFSERTQKRHSSFPARNKVSTDILSWPMWMLTTFGFSVRERNTNTVLEFSLQRLTLKPSIPERILTQPLPHYVHMFSMIRNIFPHASEVCTFTVVSNVGIPDWEEANHKGQPPEA